VNILKRLGRQKQKDLKDLGALLQRGVCGLPQRFVVVVVLVCGCWLTCWVQDGSCLFE